MLNLDSSLPEIMSHFRMDKMFWFDYFYPENYAITSTIKNFQKLIVHLNIDYNQGIKTLHAALLKIDDCGVVSWGVLFLPGSFSEIHDEPFYHNWFSRHAS